MMTFLTTFIIFLVAVFALSIGWILNQKSIKGSCGGLNAIPGMESSCSCAKPCEKRLKRIAEANASQTTESSSTQTIINRLPD